MAKLPFKNQKSMVGLPINVRVKNIKAIQNVRIAFILNS